MTAPDTSPNPSAGLFPDHAPADASRVAVLPLQTMGGPAGRRLDRLDYLVPPGMTLAPGDVVQVPLGPRTITGVVWGPGEGDLAAGRLKPVDKIVGPGNAFVAEAKRQVFGKVGIDTIAGPSEVCIISDGSAPASWIAADLLSQAEHDPSSQSILISVHPEHSEAVLAEVERQLGELATAETARAAWTAHGAIILAQNLDEACRIANQIAPEHLELAIEDPEASLPFVRHAGAVFLGAWAPEALGDYVTGSNHVLPTSGAARFSSGLGVFDFMKRMSVQSATEDGFRHLAGAAMSLAQSEHLPAHQRSVSIRFGKETET